MRLYVVATIVLFAGIALDIATTVRGIRMGAVERNPVFARQNGKVRWTLVLVLTGIGGAASVYGMFAQDQVSAAIVALALGGWRAGVAGENLRVIRRIEKSRI